MTAPLSRAHIERIFLADYLVVTAEQVRDLATTAIGLMDENERIAIDLDACREVRRRTVPRLEARVKELEQRNIEAVQAYYTAEARVDESVVALERAEAALAWYVEDVGEPDVDALEYIREMLSAFPERSENLKGGTE